MTPRSRRNVLALVLSATALAAASLPAGAAACSCAAVGSERDNARAILDGSDAAFIGVLKDVERTSMFEALFTYRVKHDYKAPLGRTVRLSAPRQGAACGVGRQEGRRYALGIDGRPGHWSSNLCASMRPRTLRKVAEEERARPDDAALCGG